jgi:hypothetical protein
MRKRFTRSIPPHEIVMKGKKKHRMLTIKMAGETLGLSLIA